MDTDKPLRDALFFTAIHISDLSERRNFLDHACRDNPAMRRMIEQLLAAEESGDQLIGRGLAAIAGSAGTLRETPADAAPADLDFIEERIGTRIGPYTLVESLGKGGCGEVYLAEQTEPVKRQVALKIIKLGMDTQSVIRRFDAERRTLAMMDHPNIARVLDAGSTLLGRPYFVLELVRGIPITDYCKQHRSSLRQRVELIIDVCRAIQHAHQKGIIHRDIKPSNVLIAEQDGVPVPKVIDFGIAKAIEEPLMDESLQTHHLQLLGTPAYMSPEQAGIGGGDVDTRSDIYSIGALLYELIAGRPPFESGSLQMKNAFELRKMLAEQEPKRPSFVLAHMSRSELPGMSSPVPERLAARMSGDLDWIVMKAIEKEASRRYDTANGFALDLQRFLNDEPVAARPPGRLYVLGKLVRRNRIVFAAGGIVLLVLIAGFGTSTLLYLRASHAEQRQAELRRTAEELLAKEAKLRREAETREKLTEAVVLARKGDLNAAAAVIGQLEVPPDKPSLDAITALRDVGKGLGGQQRWSEATKCFAWLFEINILDQWQIVSNDLQAYSVLLADAGDEVGYSRFRTTLASTHRQVTDGDEAARILKSCLLRQIDAGLEESLAPLAGTVVSWYSGLSREQQTTWASLPLCLWRYRTGDFAGAAEFAKSVLPGSNATMAYRPAYEAILAMASHQLGDTPAALAYLHSARETLDRKFATSLERGNSTVGFWYDWLFARVLVREASELIDGR
jgi:eukaryotic-like serine/threonine-protein kinase